MLLWHGVFLGGFVEGFTVAAEPFLSCGFVDDEWEVAGAHHWAAVALLVEVWASEEEGEHRGAFVGGAEEVLLALGEHVGDGGLSQSFVERVEEQTNVVFAHGFVDFFGDSVGLGWAVRWGVDWAVAWSVGVCVEDIHGGWYGVRLLIGWVCDGWGG